MGKCHVQSTRKGEISGFEIIGSVPLFHSYNVIKLFYQSLFKSQAWFDLTLDKCVETNASECDFSGDVIPYREFQLTFFCGSAPECRRVGSRNALVKVNYKLHVMNQYLYFPSQY